MPAILQIISSMCDRVRGKFNEDLAHLSFTFLIRCASIMQTVLNTRSVDCNYILCEIHVRQWIQRKFSNLQINERAKTPSFDIDITA